MNEPGTSQNNTIAIDDSEEENEEPPNVSISEAVRCLNTLQNYSSGIGNNSIFEQITDIKADIVSTFAKNCTVEDGFFSSS